MPSAVDFKITPGIFAVIMFFAASIHIAHLKCHGSEYQIENECCPKCSEGSHVKKHCTEYTSTACEFCTEGTYMEKPNGQTQCNVCSSCQSGSGLKLKRKCEPSSDTVCEPMEGFFCIEPTNTGCSAAQRHKSCEPGQYINRTGTPSVDAECSDCSSGSFSNGASTSCQPHTQCEELNLRLITAGTAAADAQCGGKSFIKTVVGLAIGIPVLVMCILGLIYGWKTGKLQSFLKQVKAACKKTNQNKPKERKWIRRDEETFRSNQLIINS